MQSLLRFCAFLAISFTAQVAAASESSSAVAAVKRTHPQIKWDEASLTKVNLRGTRAQAAAILGNYKDRLLVAVIPGPIVRSTKPHLMEFSIGPSVQAAVCEAPARIAVTPLECSPVDELLAGCRMSKGAQSLEIYGGECDPIYIYWDHKLRRPRWWRL
jgi:hypothetical protein